MGHGTAAVSGLVVSVVRALVLVGVVKVWVRGMVVVVDTALVHNYLPCPVALVVNNPRMMSVPSSSLDIADAGIVVVADVGVPNNNSDGNGMAAKDGAAIPVAAVDMHFGSNTEKNHQTTVDTMVIIN